MGVKSLEVRGRLFELGIESKKKTIVCVTTFLHDASETGGLCVCH